MAALDGLRAVAVVAVVAYHASLEHTPGGFFGVDVFFVISGYLVTSLFLLRSSSDRLSDTVDFWKRRALRLVPAALAAVLVTWLAFVLLDVREPGSLSSEAAAALGYVANWFFLFRNQSYFETISQPSPFLHFWSLAVEAQFYLIWPLLLLAAMRFGGRLATFAMAISLAAVSTVVVASLYDPASDPSRAYYGTDSRAAGLLLGAAVAIVLRPGFSGRGVRPVVEVTGWAGMAALVWLVTQVSEFDPFIYQGGFFLAASATVGVILAALHGRNSVAYVLSLAPLRWLGQRSYSIYLWHWPVFVLTQPQLSIELRSFSLLLARLGATLILAELSYRLVENRFRSGGDWWRLPKFERTTPDVWREPWARPAAIVSAGVLAIVIAGGLPIRTGLASELAEEAAVVATQEAITVSESPPVSTATPLAPVHVELPASMIPITPTPEGTSSAAAPTAAPTAEPSGTSSAVPAPASTATATAVPSGTPPAGSAVVSAIGDSVMLGAKAALEEAIPGITVDAEVGRQLWSGDEVASAMREAGTLGDIVVVQLGDNGMFTTAQFDALMDSLAGVKVVIFVNVTVPRRWEGEVNEALAEQTAGRDGVVLADWHSISAEEASFFGADGVHLTGAGRAAYAALIHQHVLAAIEQLDQ